MSTADVSVPLHLERFLDDNAGAWALFDLKYFHNSDTMPEGYEPGHLDPVLQYCIGRVSSENVRSCMCAWPSIKAPRAAELHCRPISDRRCRRIATAVLLAANRVAPATAHGALVAHSVL